MLWPLTRNLMSDPFSELSHLQRGINRLFDTGSDAGLGSYPPVNVWVNENDLALTAEIPGLDKGDFDISVNGDQLTIEGEKKLPELSEGAKYVRRERRSGRFVRHFQLPFDADAEQVKASYANGILTVRVPRSEATKPRKITIN